MGGCDSKLASEIQTVGKDERKYAGYVAGSTGATGRHIVKELVQSDFCEKVYALVRMGRVIDLNDDKQLLEVFPEIDPLKAREKLEVIQVDYENEVSLPVANTELRHAFSALGTSPFSEKVDYWYSMRFAEAAKALNADSLHLVSSKGAKANSLVPYLAMMGKREDDFTELKVGGGRTIIARPGALEREDLMRTKEKVISFLSAPFGDRLKIDCRHVARAIVTVAEMKKTDCINENALVLEHRDLIQISESSQGTTK